MSILNTILQEGLAKGAKSIIDPDSSYIAARQSAHAAGRRVSKMLAQKYKNPAKMGKVFAATGRKVIGNEISGAKSAAQIGKKALAAAVK